MVNVNFGNDDGPQIDFDTGALKDENPELIIGYFIANDKVVSEKKREELLNVILDTIERHNNICYVERITDDFIELYPSDESVGPVEFKIYMSTTTNKPEGTASKPESDLFLKDLFVSIQKCANDVFRISSMEDHLTYTSKGMLPLPLDHGEVPEKERTYFSVEECQDKKEEMLKISESLPFTNKPIEVV